MGKPTAEEFAALDYIDPRSEEIILEHGYLTGSALFFPDMEPSDYDYIMPPSLFYLTEDLVEHSLAIELEYGDPLATLPAYFKFRKHDKLVNVIFTNSAASFKAWTTATDVVLSIIGANPVMAKLLQHRIHRVALFKTIRTIVYTDYTAEKSYGTPTS